MKNIFRFTAVVGVLAVWVLAVACSDGATPVIPELQCSLPQPAAGLMAKKVGEADEAAVKGKITIASGEGVVILWDVQGLSGGEIVSNPPEVIGQPEVLVVVEEEKEVVNADGEKEKQKVKTAKGSKEFTVLKENVEFTLKAINTDKDLPCENVTSSVSVEVTPEMAKPEVKKFEATPAQINTGESSKLCWEVAPESAAVTIVDDAGNALVPPVVETTETPPATPEVLVAGQLSASAAAKALTAKGETVPEAAEAAEEATVASFKAVDCVDVKPERTTVYTLTARANDVTATADATVTITNVKEEFKIVSFAANSVEGSLTLDAAADVKLTWEVTPSDGVLVSIDNGVGDNLPAKGEAAVKVSDNTIYTLSASREGVVLAKQVTVNVQRGVSREQLVLRAKPLYVVFPGEEAELKWEVKTSSGGAINDAVVMLRGGDFGEEGVSKQGVSGTEKVKPSNTTEYSLEATVEGYLPVTKTVKVIVRNWFGPEVPSGTNASTVAVDPTGVGRAFMGYRQELSKDGSGDLLIMMSKGAGDPPLWNEIKFNFSKGFNGTGSYQGEWGMDFFSKLGDYPVNTFAFDPANPSHVYAGIAGGILYSHDGGSSFSMLEKAIVTDNGDYGGSHPSCKGYDQKGKTGDKVVSVEQICDIMITSTGRFIVAGDHKLGYLPNGVEAFLVDKKEKANWWVVPKGNDQIHGQVNYDLEVARTDGGETIVLGNPNGVLLSRDDGATFTVMDGSPAEPIYSVSYDSINNVLLAGGSDTVYRCEGFNGSNCSKNWESVAVSGGKIISLAVENIVDGATINYAGTESGGLYFSKDEGMTWNVLATPTMGKTVNSISAISIGNDSAVYVATDAGLFGSTVTGLSRLVGNGSDVPTVPQIPIESTVPAASAVNVMRSLAK